MAGLSESVQIAVYSKLSSDAALAALLADRIGYPGTPAIYDDVTQAGDGSDSSVFPYIVIGGDNLRDWSTDTASGGDLDVIIDVWSRYDGKKETKQIQSAIYNALHRQDLTVPDHEFIGCDFTAEQPVVIDPDGHTYHGVIEFRVFIDEPGYGN